MLIIGLIAFRAASNSVPIFDLRFNPFALVSLAAMLANLIIGGMILSRRSEFENNEAVWYFLFLITIILFSTFEMLQRLSATPGAALFWAQLGGIGPAFEPVGLFLFALFYVSRRTRSVALIPILLVGAGILFFFHGNGGLVFQTSPTAIKLYTWGYNNDVGDAFALNALWVLGLPTIALGMLMRFHYKTRSPILKHQSRLFAVAVASPLVGAVLFDILAPTLGLKVPPLHDVFTVFTAGLMLYVFRRFKVFEVSPASLAGDILSTMTESVVVTDSQLKIELMNEAAERMFGRKFDQIGGTSLFELFDHNQVPYIKRAIEQMSNANNKYTIGNYVVGGQSHPVFVRITADKITEQHGAPGFAFAMTDITELQQSYVALENEKKDVERKVEARTTELKAAQKRLTESDKIKTEFVVLTSHNLRTPLATMQGNIELLTRSQLDENQHKYVSSLLDSSQRLGNLVEELLTISSIEAGDRSVLEHTTVHDILEPLVAEARTLAVKTQNSFSVVAPDQDAEILANVARLQTAIHNLLENAFKFTKQGIIKLEVTVNETAIVMSVIDTGIGISADQLTKLFTEFHHSSGQNEFSNIYGGEGIGLYLTKLIVEEHGGHISVSSELGHGSKFVITLPRPTVLTPDADY